MKSLSHNLFKKIPQFLLLLFIGLSACTTKEEVVPFQSDYLVESKLIGEYTKQTVINESTAQGTGGLNTFFVYDIQVYKISYKTTDTKGNTVTASGLVIIPKNRPTAAPLLSHQHGTITNDADAPSYYGKNSEAYLIAKLLASTGYIVSCPDYLGYGDTKNIEHPYEHAKTLGSASLDMLRAARDFCKQQNIAWNNKLFLAGYSEGGYATMALHKLIEEKHSAEFQVTASAPGAGAYHKTAFAEYIFAQNQNLNFLNYYIWALDSYNKIYGLNRPWNTYLNEPNATTVSQQSSIRNVVGLTLDKNPQTLFTANLRNGVLNQTDTEIRNVLKDNDIHDWKPASPLRMFHGTSDDFVPILNSENALNAMKAKGATQVELIRLNGRDHYTAVGDYLLGIYVFFSVYQ